MSGCGAGLQAAGRYQQTYGNACTLVHCGAAVCFAAFFATSSVGVWGCSRAPGSGISSTSVALATGVGCPAGCWRPAWFLFRVIPERFHEFLDRRLARRDRRGLVAAERVRGFFEILLGLVKTDDRSCQPRVIAKLLAELLVPNTRRLRCWRARCRCRRRCWLPRLRLGTCRPKRNTADARRTDCQDPTHL